METADVAVGRSVPTPDGVIHYHEAGSGDPVVLVHGSGPGTNGLGTFRPTIGALAPIFRVLAIDMPGWGRSYGSNYDARHQVDALTAFLDALGLDRVALVGSSLGGRTCLQFLADQPSRARRLVTLGAAAPGVDAFSTGAGEAGDAFLQAYLDPSPETIRRFASAMVFDQALVTEELVDARLADIVAAAGSSDGFLEGMAAARERPSPFPDLVPALQRSTVPVLAIHGREDRLVSFESALRIVAMLPDSDLLLLGRCGHWAQLERAVDVNTAIANFLTWDA